MLPAYLNLFVPKKGPTMTLEIVMESDRMRYAKKMARERRYSERLN